jgi:RNA polymerase sigma-54 factor
MAMKPALALRLSQQLRMTPQLQQAIKLLQLSTTDLEQEIQEALDSNLMLEEAAEEDARGDDVTSLNTPDQTIEGTPLDDPAPEGTADAEDISDAEGADNVERIGEIDAPDPIVDPEVDGDLVPDTSEELASGSIADELPVDSAWEDIWEAPITQYGGDDESNQDYLETRNTADISIQSHLLEQAHLLNISDADQILVWSILDGLDANGRFKGSLEEILPGIPVEFEVGIEEAEAVLHLVQHLDPIGIAARDLRECLLIQLALLPADEPFRDDAIAVVEQHLAALASRDFAQLLRKVRLKEDDLKNVITLIQTLNPYPGSDIAPSNTEYVDPDVIVTRQNDRWLVELNPKSAPRIRINSDYATIARKSANRADKTYLNNHLQEAKWFIKSLQQRNDTLLRVSRQIVEYQRGFLDYGEQAMKPLVLHDVAQAVGLHESTISRVTNQKYMRTPTGVFELKYFFSSHVSTHAGGEVSSTAIRALIKELVAEENPRKPLSDSKMAKLLSDQDIKVARRTIAKYRESLMIPPSNERKQLV